MTFRIGYITHYDLDGITTVAGLKRGEQNGKNESSVYYIAHSDLLSHLLKIDSKIDKLYITDLVVPGTIDISDELYRIANENPKKYRRDKITIITDKKVRSNIKKISGVDVYSAEWAQNHNQSSSQMAYNYMNERKGQEPDNICCLLATLGAAGDGLLRGTIYDDTIAEAIEMDYAIRQNKKDPEFLDKIVLELTKYGSIEDKDIKEKIKADSGTFRGRIDDASKIIKEGIIYNEGEYLISTVDNGELPYGVATSAILNENEGKIVIVMIKNNGYNRNGMLMRGHGKGSLYPVLDALKQYRLKGGGHDSNKPTESLEVPKELTDEIIQKMTSFCSNPHGNKT